jgi:hypothetical protein
MEEYGGPKALQFIKFSIPLCKCLSLLSYYMDDYYMMVRLLTHLYIYCILLYTIYYYLLIIDESCVKEKAVRRTA